MSLDHNSFIQALRVGMTMGRTPRIPYLESQQITKEGNVTAVSTAVQRINMVRKATRLYIACVIDGVGRVYYSFPEKLIQFHRWVPTYFSEAAEDIAITFNGRTYRNGSEGREFITDVNPWVFWVYNGECRGKILNNLGETLFASENCTKVDAICDLSKDGYFEGLGLVLFMLIEGKIYYRQLMNGVWTDAELISYGPENVVWTDIQAFRTWDFRIGLQAITDDGTVYEFFSRYKGFSHRLTDHVDMSDAHVFGSFFKITWHYAKEDEHVSLSNVNKVDVLYGGLYRIGSALISEAYNIEDENHNWGTTLVIKFDRHLDGSNIYSQYNAFTLTDSSSRSFTPYQALFQDDGLTVILIFYDFNPATGLCSISFTPGSITTMAGYSVQSTSLSFTPVNLTGPTVDPPVVVNIKNI